MTNINKPNFNDNFNNDDDSSSSSSGEEQEMEKKISLSTIQSPNGKKKNNNNNNNNEVVDITTTTTTTATPSATPLGLSPASSPKLTSLKATVTVTEAMSASEMQRMAAEQFRRENGWTPKEMRFRTKMCSFFYYTRFCQKGARCNFSHEFKPGMEVPVPPTSIAYHNPKPPQEQLYYPEGTQNVPCKYFFERGLCLKGDACKFSHVIHPAPYPASRDFCPSFFYNPQKASALPPPPPPSAALDKENVCPRNNRKEKKKWSENSCPNTRKLHIVRRAKVDDAMDVIVAVVAAATSSSAASHYEYDGDDEKA